MVECGYCGLGEGHAPLFPSVVYENGFSHASCEEHAASEPRYMAKMAALHKQQLEKEEEEKPTPKHDVQCVKCNRSFSSFKNPNSKNKHDKPQCKVCGQRIELVVVQ